MWKIWIQEQVPGYAIPTDMGNVLYQLGLKQRWSKAPCAILRTPSGGHRQILQEEGDGLRALPWEKVAAQVEGVGRT